MAAGKPDTKNLELKGKTWWCVKSVPPSLRDRLPTKLRKNLQTSSIREAQSRRAFALAHFEAEIRRARNTEPADPIEEEALKFREYDWSQATPVYETWKGEPLELDPKSVALSLEVERLEQKKTPAKDIERFVDIATGTKTPVLTYLEKWLEWDDVAPATKIEKRRAVKALASWRQGICIEDVSRKVAGEFLDHIKKSGYSAETTGKYLTGLNTYWNWLEARGHIETSSPWTRHRNKKRRNGRSEYKKRPFTDDEIVTLLRGNANRRLLDFMLISALSGMRLNEIGRLRVRDCADGAFAVSATKRGAKDRLVPIHSDLTEIISRRTKNKKPDDFLFHELPNPKPGSTRERADCITQEFGRYTRQIGVAETRPDGQAANDFHSFRRWFSTKLHQANVMQHLAAAVVGHAAGSLTYDLYSGGPSRKQLQDVVEAVKLPSEVMPLYQLPVAPQPKRGRPKNTEASKPETTKAIAEMSKAA